MDRFYKLPGERFFIGVDFAKVLDESETIDESASTVTAYDNDGQDVSDQVLESGTKQLSEQKLRVRVKGGEMRKAYKIKFVASTTDQNTYEKNIYMIMKEN